MGNEILDVKKFGFLLEEEMDGVLLYRKHFPEFNLTIELERYKNVFSLFKKDVLTDDSWEIASRYRIANQAQLDFLILNGRLGVFFDPV